MARHYHERDYTQPGELIKAFIDDEIDVLDALEYAPLAAMQTRALYDMRRNARIKEKKKVSKKVVDKVLC